MNFKKEINKHNGDNFLPKYSICICNYNMADTIEKALTSVLDQIDERFEVLLVDDGSSDKSVEIIRKIQKKYSSLRLITLQRSSKRQLGKTRNLSVKEAKGEYVILHVDADDYWEPYIITFINLFHRLESLIKKDILVAGNQINIGKRNFLLKYGPYRNTHRAQDRDMWHRLASIDRYIPVDHLPFRQRLSRPNSVRIYRVFRNTWFQILYDLRNDKKRYCYVFACLLSIFKRNKNVTLRLKIVRIILILPAYIKSYFCEPLLPPALMPTHQQFVSYREKVRGTFQELFARYGSEYDLSDMTKKEQKIFKNKV